MMVRCDWQVKTRHPRSDRDLAQVALAVLPLEHGGLATSGNYERFLSIPEIAIAIC